MRVERSARAFISALVVLAVGLGAFYAVRASGRGAPRRDAPALQGSPEAGRLAIQRHGCYACHTIAGVPRATGQVGPPLNGVSERRYLAGVLTNTPQNMRLWIMAPQRFSPGTAMPDMGVTESEATDIVAYLYGIR